MNVWSLLEIAESTDAPMFIKGEFGNVVFDAKDGWKVSIFYDCQELDYIDRFISHCGGSMDFWEWPESDDKNVLMCWRGIGDIERLRVCS